MKYTQAILFMDRAMPVIRGVLGSVVPKIQHTKSDVMSYHSVDIPLPNGDPVVVELTYQDRVEILKSTLEERLGGFVRCSIVSLLESNKDGKVKKSSFIRLIHLPEMEALCA